jgi:ammonium transporter, Amt family
VFLAIKYTVGLRVSESHELAGLDISEHGMYGYPERFIDVPGAMPEEHFIPSPSTATSTAPPAAAPATSS